MEAERSIKNVVEGNLVRVKVNVIWNTVGNIFGLRSTVVRDDSTVLPFIKEALRRAGYGEDVGIRVPSSGWQHAVRRLGKDKVVKFSAPFDSLKVEKFISYLNRQRGILQKYCSPYLTPDDFIFVPLNSSRACYAVVKKWVAGRPLYALSDEELKNNRLLASSLLDLVERGEKMYAETGYALDLAEPGMFLINFLNPRKTSNIVVNNSSSPFYIDTVLIPPEFDPSYMPKIYQYSPLWYFIYRYATRLRGKVFKKRLVKYLDR